MLTLLQNGMVYQAGHLQQLDVLLKDDKIAAIGVELAALLPSTAEVKKYDLQNLLVTPGLVDVHVHYRQPGYSQKETIKTGSLAAAHGGFTTVGAMPNLDPVPDTPANLKAVIDLNRQDGVVHILQYAAITQRRQGKAVNNLAALKAAGAFAVSDDGSGIQSAEVMYRAMQQAAAAGLPLAEHIEDESLLFNGVINAGPKATELNLPGMSSLSESSQLARDLILAQATGVHYHACHISTKASVALIRWAKQQGIQVTCEASPHHLLLADQDIPADDSNYKMNPPLRSKADRQALLAGLADGTIDMIATDHAPHTEADKAGGFYGSAFGITGSETAFSMLYTQLVKTHQLSLERLLELLTIKPAQAFGLHQAGELLPGRIADIAVFDLQHPTVISAKDYYSKGKNTPFTGEKVYGQTQLTFVAGQAVYQKED
ncbi:MAG: dihydroorotase [Liquorilactobacillus ghanensis]|uniref:dihydroorotase n=1 Tax=Liquorilactobacillus ghanensis TaxID=399370 RepID=UPI0039EC6A8C